MCGSHVKKELSTDGLHRLCDSSFGDPIFKNRSGTTSEKTVPLNLSEYYI